MKKCIIIPDSFKGTMSSEEVCNIEYRLLSEAFPECRFVTLPVADGGEGTLSCFLHGMNGERIKVSVRMPLAGRLRAATAGSETLL